MIYPPFLEKALALAAACRARGVDYWATFGFRSFAESEALYRAYRAGNGARAAPAGKSAHNFGLAFDFTRDSSPAPGLQPDWSAHAEDILGEEAVRLGLVWGASFGDGPHVQWPGYVSGAQLEPLREIWVSCPSDWSDSQRIAECWKHITP